MCDNGSEDDSLGRIKAWADGRLDASPPAELPPGCVLPAAHVATVPYIEGAGISGIAGPDAACGGPSGGGADAKLILFQTGRNLGFGGANNVALRWILGRKDGDYVWLLNNDTIVPRDTLSTMVRDAAGHCGITGSVLRAISAPHALQAFGGGHVSPLTGWTRPELKESRATLGYVCGASLMLDRRVLSAVGLFDENIFMYFEDADYGIRAQRLGFTMRTSEATVFHKVGGSDAGSFFAWKHAYRNKVYVLLKHYGFRWWVLCSGLAWLAHLIDPFALPAKRRASMEALACLGKAARTRLVARTAGRAGGRG